MKALSKLGYAIFVFAMLIASCRNEQPQQEAIEEPQEGDITSVALTAAQFKTAGIALGKPEQKQISGTIKVNGVLDVPPQQLVSISAPMAGFLKSTDLLEGSRVKKGQRIAVIENLEFIQIQQDYLEAKSQYEFALADFQRQEELAKENVNSQKILQQSKASYQTWLARFNGLKEKLNVLNLNTTAVESGDLKSTISLYSPIDGYVTAVNANIGKFVNPTDALFEIVDTEHLHAELIIFEKDVPKIRIGQKVRFTLANETRERTATVYLIGREISADRTIPIHCHIDQEDKELLPGMYLMAVVETGGALVPAVPNEAVIDFQGRKYLFVATEDEMHFRMVEVETGNTELGYTEITLPEGISEETQIVTKGAYSLLSKMKNSEEEGGHGD